MAVSAFRRQLDVADYRYRGDYQHALFAANARAKNLPDWQRGDDYGVRTRVDAVV